MKTKTLGRSLVLAACATVLCGRHAAAGDSPFAELEGKIHEMKAAAEPARKAAEAARADRKAQEAQIVLELASALKHALRTEALKEYAYEYDCVRISNGRLVYLQGLLLPRSIDSGLGADSFVGTPFMIAMLVSGEALVYKPLFPKDVVSWSELGPSRITDEEFGAALGIATRESVIEENARRAAQQPIRPSGGIEFVK